METKQEIKTNKFGKSDLKPGMIVKTRNGEVLLYIENYLEDGDNLFIGKDWSSISEYNNDLTHKSVNSDLDIVEVWRPNCYAATIGFIANPKMFKNKATCIWERVEIVELTLEDIAEKFNLKAEQILIKD